MRLVKGSLASKLAAGARSAVALGWHRGRLQSEGLFHVGHACAFYLTSPEARIELGRRVHLEDHVTLESAGLLRIGAGSSLNSYSRVVALERVEIGERVTIASFVTILDHDHDWHFEDGRMRLEGYVTRPVRIGDDVWIGERVTVLKGVTIGSNVVVAAHSLIHRDVPPNSLVAGSPFRVLRRLG